MKHVFYDYKSPTTFEEHLDFNYNLPYTVRIKKFVTQDIVPLHYGDTIELLVCDNLVGEFKIENQIFTLRGKQLFIVPPNIVHSNSIQKCDGIMYVIKISLDAMSNFIDLPEIFEYSNQHIMQLQFTCPEYDRIMQLVANLIKFDENIFACLSNIISIFGILFEYTAKFPQKNPDNYSLKNSNLRDLIKWTQNNFHKNISIQDVANMVGYSKSYFCNKFKSITGTTYLDYLNSVRISHACCLLKQNKSISNVCRSCGFDNVSYFIQLFKKTHGKTPKVFATEHQKRVMNSTNN